mgnify:CR=1 FL=1
MPASTLTPFATRATATSELCPPPPTSPSSPAPAPPSRSHPNIVQVLTFFTDACVLVGDTPIEALGRRLSGLDGVAELMRLTKLPSHRHPLAGLPGSRSGAGGPVEGIAEDGVTEEEAAAAAVAAANAVLPRTGVIVLVQEFCDAGTLKNAINQRAFFDRSTGEGRGGGATFVIAYGGGLRGGVCVHQVVGRRLS